MDDEALNDSHMQNNSSCRCSTVLFRPCDDRTNAYLPVLPPLRSSPEGLFPFPKVISANIFSPGLLPRLEHTSFYKPQHVFCLVWRIRPRSLRDLGGAVAGTDELAFRQAGGCRRGGLDVGDGTRAGDQEVGGVAETGLRVSPLMEVEMYGLGASAQSTVSSSCDLGSVLAKAQVHHHSFVHCHVGAEPRICKGEEQRCSEGAAGSTSRF